MEPNDPNLAQLQDVFKTGDMKEIASILYEYLATTGLNILAAILIFIIGRWLAKLVANLVGKAMIKAKIDKTLVNFVKNLSYVVLLIFVIIAALARIGIQTASFVALLGAAGLAIGLAWQGSLANLASGILMMIFRPFKAGDFVEVKGVVKDVHIFNTILNTLDNVRVIIPNSQVTGGNIFNYTINGTRRVDLVIGISYEDDIKKAKQIIEQTLAADPKVLKDPAPTVAVMELADSSVNFAVRPWCEPKNYWDVYFGTIENVKLALDQNGITIPFPQRDVHMITEQSA